MGPGGDLWNLFPFHTISVKLSLYTQDQRLSQTGVTLPQAVCAGRKSSSGCPANYNSYFPDIFNDTSEETLERAYELWVKDCKPKVKVLPQAWAVCHCKVVGRIEFWTR